MGADLKVGCYRCSGRENNAGAALVKSSASATVVKVTANGKRRAIAAGVSVQKFVEQQGLAAERVVIEYNGEPLRRELFAVTVLRSGDKLEIAQMVGGG
jgi:thiamine biosynthesis protein ThiS